MKLKLLFFPLSIVIALLFFVYFTKPIWNDYSQNNKSIEAEETNLKIIGGNKDNLSEVVVVYNQVNADEKLLLNNSIPESIKEEGFLKELNDVAVTSGIKISEIALIQMDESKSNEDLESDNNIKEIEASISLDGNYFGLKKALYLIENLNRFVRINSFSIKKNEIANNLNLNLEVVLFYKKSIDKSKLNTSSHYLNSLLKNGLEIEIVENYMLYREKVVDFSFIESENKGKDNLFDVLGGTDLEIVDIEKEITAEEEAVIDSEINQDQSEENDPVE